MQRQKKINKTDSNITSSYKATKIVELVIIFLFELGFYIFISVDKTLGNHVYDNRPVFFLCCIIWIFMLVVLVFLLFDFIVIRKMLQERHLLNQIAYLDGLTGIPNRHSIDILFKTYNTPSSLENVCCAVYKIANIKEINAILTHEEGDSIIRDFCDLFESLGDEYGFVGRNGGNEFIIVINDCSKTLIDSFDSHLKKKINVYNNEKDMRVPLIITGSYVLNSELKASSFSDLLSTAYQHLNMENK